MKEKRGKCENNSEGGVKHAVRKYESIVRLPRNYKNKLFNRQGGFLRLNGETVNLICNRVT